MHRNMFQVPADIQATVEAITASARARFGHGTHFMRLDNPVIARLEEQRSAQCEFIDQVCARAAEEGRDLVEAEVSNINAARERVAEIDAQLKPLMEFEQARAAHQETASQYRPTAQAPAGGTPAGGGEQRGMGYTQPRAPQYRTAGEFLVDYIRARGYEGEQVRPDADAQQRVAAAMEVRANQTTTETPGLLPEPIVGGILTDLDASRPFVSSLGAKPLAGIPGKVFHRPRVTQHTQVGKQTAEKTELASRQFIVQGVPFTKETFGGWLNVSRQDIDWTSPAAWDALVSDLELEYGADTDDAAAAAFATAVTQQVTWDDELTDPTARLRAIIAALYAAARIAATANGTKRASALRLPNHIWTSIDQWEVLGVAVDQHRALVQGSASPGSSSPASFAGSILDVPRTMVPGLPAGTIIVGRTNLVEFYEERIGLLQAVEPRVLGVEVAYGGYAAYGTLDATGFAKVAGDAA